MTVNQIFDIAKTVTGFSYWWGGSKWKPGAADIGKCIPNGSSGCPNCSHTGAYGADCSGFVGKAWQVDKPMALDVAYHPYSTVHFTGQTTWWTHPPKADAQPADAFTYNKDGAGHIFLYEKGNPSGSVYAWECKGCSYGCVYNLRSISPDYIVARRKLIETPPACKKHCEGTSIVGEDCGKVDCAAYGAKCVDDNLGVRCVSVFCPAQGTTTTCLPDPKNAKIATCVNGALKDEANCGAYGAICSTAVPPKPKCVVALCEDNPKAAPKAGDLCFQNKRMTCNTTGDIKDNPCPASSPCQTAAGKTGPGSGTCGPVACGDCNDSNPCTDDSCSNGACVHKANTKACDDSDGCTTGDVCANSDCNGSAKSCDDGSACTADACSKGQCTHLPNSGECDDGNVCTTDSCGGKGCESKPKDGQCEDGDGCTSGGACKNGNCSAAAVKQCDDDNACTTDSCTNGECVYGPSASDCDDGDACTLGDYCAKSLCLAGSSNPCDDGKACTNDTCAVGACIHTPDLAKTVRACEGNAVVESNACSGAMISKTACDVNKQCDAGACKTAAEMALKDASGDTGGSNSADGGGSAQSDSSLGALDGSAAAPTGNVSNGGNSASSCQSGRSLHFGTLWSIVAVCGLILARRRKFAD
ncbi:MAG: hypothetical protein EXR77_02750 [Myxococcales bacterium]|nr:hypothetical protein [Myxococcales bacterium]